MRRRRSGSEFKISPDGRSLTYVKEAGIGNLWDFSLENKKETPLTDFTTGKISAFIWPNEGKTLLIVKAVYQSDLVLIKDKGKSRAAINSTARALGGFKITDNKAEASG